MIPPGEDEEFITKKQRDIRDKEEEKEVSPAPHLPRS
jgi:hypothetical protein